jgi:hypothetical protein
VSGRFTGIGQAVAAWLVARELRLVHHNDTGPVWAACHAAAEPAGPPPAIARVISLRHMVTTLARLSGSFVAVPWRRSKAVLASARVRHGRTALRRPHQLVGWAWCGGCG